MYVCICILYLLSIAGQTDGPNWQKFFERTHGCPECISISSGFFPLNFAASRFVNIQSLVLLDHIITNDTNIFQNIQSISDHNTIFLPIILDLKHNENSFKNLLKEHE